MREARRAGGTFEPEMRLKLMWAPAVVIVGGLLMVGLGPYYEAHWIVFVLGLGMLNLAGPFATAIVLNYAFDCYHPVEPNNKYGAQAITHQAAPYLLSALIISMSMAFGYVGRRVTGSRARVELIRAVFGRYRATASRRGSLVLGSGTLASPLRL